MTIKVIWLKRNIFNLAWNILNIIIILQYRYLIIWLFKFIKKLANRKIVLDYTLENKIQRHRSHTQPTTQSRPHMTHLLKKNLSLLSLFFWHAHLATTQKGALKSAIATEVFWGNFFIPFDSLIKGEQGGEKWHVYPRQWYQQTHAHSLPHGSSRNAYP